MEILPLDLVYVWSSVCGKRGQTSLQTDRRDDNIHLALITAQAGRVKWTRVVNESYFIWVRCMCVWVSVCPLCVLRQVSDLVLIDPIPEDVFEEDQWKEYWWVHSCFQGHGKDKKEQEYEGGGRRKDGEMLKKQKLGRSGREDWERGNRKRSKEDDKELWGAERSR